MEAPEDAQILHNLIALKDKELANLKEELEQLDKNARTAAMFGKQLLEQNQELSIEMDRQSKTRETQIEELEQETYALRGKVKELTLANKSQHEDIETLERTLKQEELDKQRHLELEHGARVEELRRQLETTAGEAKEREMRLQEQLQEQQQVAEKLRLQLQVQQNETQHNLTLQCENDELIALQITCNDLRTEKVVLEGKVSTLETAIAKLQGELIHVQKALERREEELESVKIENASSRGQVEKYKDECQELQVVIHQLEMQTVDPNKKGNSLFAEVDDRRVNLEEHVKSLINQNDSLNEKYSLAKDHLSKLKVQLASVMQMCSQRVDSTQLTRLNQQLCQAQSEIIDLTHQIQILSAKRKEEDVKQCAAATSSGDQHFKAFMDSLLERAEKEKLSLSKQLEYKRFQLIAETDKLLQCERRLSESQATVSKLQAVNVRLQVKLQARDVQQGDKNQQSNDTVNATGARIEKIALKPPTKEAFSLKEHNISKRTEAKTSNNELKVNEGKFSTLPEKSDEVVIEKKRTRLVSFSPSSIDKEEEEEERGTIDEPQCAKPIPGGRKRGIQNQKRLVDAHAYQRENNAECNQQ